MLLRFIAAAIALLVADAAFAQGTPAQRAACRPDVVKFCKGKGEDPGVLLQCLEDNRDKISEKCRNVLIEVNGPAPTAAKKEAPAALPEKKEDTPSAQKDEKK
ncbi:MAG TPA: cysteine rich repeat-containing protein [Xanthobacteraceae bacterium]|nr:cysteine rich repeat-containing protein [Xanthobacteraceae bacterium]